MESVHPRDIKRILMVQIHLEVDTDFLRVSLAVLVACAGCSF